MRTGFAAGVTLADGTALSPAEVTCPFSRTAWTVRVKLRQGVYHQIKRMFGVYARPGSTACTGTPSAALH